MGIQPKQRSHERYYYSKSRLLTLTCLSSAGRCRADLYCAPPRPPTTPPRGPRGPSHPIPSITSGTPPHETTRQPHLPPPTLLPVVKDVVIHTVLTTLHRKNFFSKNRELNLTAPVTEANDNTARSQTYLWKKNSLWKFCPDTPLHHFI